MYKRQRVKKLGRKKTHRESLINNQLRSLFENGHVRTTTSKANVLRKNAERLISRYSEDISFRRKLGEILGNKKIVESYLKYVKKEKTGVKMVKVGFRPGDMTEMSRVELINFKEKKAKKVETKEEPKKKEEKVEMKEFDKKELEKKSQRIEKPKKVIVSKERAKTRSGL
jgi:large subunit ribosomal protein L17